MTNREIILDGMDSCKLFNCFNDIEKSQLADLAIVKSFPAGENIFTIRHKDEYFFLVYEGTLSLRLKTRKIKKYQKGEVFGEVSIFSDKLRSGNIRAVEQSTLIAFDSHKIFETDIITSKTQFKLIRRLTETIIGYLYEENSISTQKIIKNGESISVEFKKALNPTDKEYKKKLVHTINAFMNAKGGTILVGVNDNGKVVGINNQNSTIEKFMNSIVDIIEDRLGNYASSLVDFDVDQVHNKKLLRIDIDKSMEPIVFRENKSEECFFVRIGASNRRLKKTLDIIKYYEKNFKH